MNIEEAIEQINKMLKIEKDCLHYDVCKQDIEAIETLLTAYNDIKTEHKIMKRLIVENGLWERLLNDDEFIKHLEEE